MFAELLGQVAEQEVAEPARRILIVDDDADQTLCLQTRLSRLGYRADAAHTGRDGLAMARTCALMSCCWTYGCPIAMVWMSAGKSSMIPRRATSP